MAKTERTGSSLRSFGTGAAAHGGVFGVIVHCPSCGTRYRHSPAPAETPHSAQCGRCEHVFPLTLATRSYVLVERTVDGRAPRAGGAPGATRPRLEIGMDDPSIAARLGRTSLTGRVSGNPVLTYRVYASQAPKPATPKAARARSTVAAEPRPGWGAALWVLITAAAGAAAGWYLAPRLPGEPETWVLAGGGVGLIAAWLGLRWAQSRH